MVAAVPSQDPVADGSLGRPIGDECIFNDDVPRLSAPAQRERTLSLTVPIHRNADAVGVVSRPLRSLIT
jgi:hypothetical protein